MTTSDLIDLRRELAKAHDALAAVETYLARHAEANAALHCADRVLYSPLHARVATTLQQLQTVLKVPDARS